MLSNACRFEPIIVQITVWECLKQYKYNFNPHLPGVYKDLNTGHEFSAN